MFVMAAEYVEPVETPDGRVAIVPVAGYRYIEAYVQADGHACSTCEGTPDGKENLSNFGARVELLANAAELALGEN